MIQGSAQVRPSRFVRYAVFENCTPCARGASSEKLSVHALQRTYCFQASPPDSRPQPVLYVALNINYRRRSTDNTHLVAAKCCTNLGATSANVDL